MRAKRTSAILALILVMGFVDAVHAQLASGWQEGICQAGHASYDYATGIWTLSCWGPTLTEAGSGYCLLWTDELVYTHLEGDGAITVHVGVSELSEDRLNASVIVGEGLVCLTKYATMTVYDDGNQYRYSFSCGGTASGSTSIDRTDPWRWMRIKRTGDRITGEISYDGRDWTELGSCELPMTSDVGIGFSVPPGYDSQSHRDLERVVQFDNVTVAGDTGVRAGVPDNDWMVSGNGMYSAVPGNVGIGTKDPAYKLDVYGTTATNGLIVRGGADVAEPFLTSGQMQMPKGAVVVIDPANAGRLKLSSRPYDRCVAGVVSGAGGLNPGLTLSQQGVVEGGVHVALTGRVYALADCSNGSIKPGDMLTTSRVPGYAMKATDRKRSYGAVIGKAMSPLEKGRGLVLVLVSLQ